MRNSYFSTFVCIILCFLLPACQLINGNNYPRPNFYADIQDHQYINSDMRYRITTQYKNLTDYGEANVAQLKAALGNRHQQSHIIQLGDSHTAADFFSGTLRELFQAQYGDAGIGFVPPVSVPGQRTANINRRSKKGDWQLITSRRHKNDNFTLGGYIASPLRASSSVQLLPYVHKSDDYYLQVLYQSDRKNSLFVNSPRLENTALANTRSDWFFSRPLRTKLPATVSFADKNGLRIAGWLLVNAKPGVIFSTLGINGATINMINDWHNDWQQAMQLLAPDMVILSYGTNSALFANLDIKDYQRELAKIVRQIRTTSPRVTILIVGAADAINRKKGVSFEKLDAIIGAQRAVARKEHTLFWDWRAYMGGKGSMAKWAKAGRAQKDHIHFTVAGYNAAAKALYEQLQHYLN